MPASFRRGCAEAAYLYAWAEWTLKRGLPERFTQQALGHNPKVVRHAYAKRAEVTVASLHDRERLSQKKPRGLKQPRLPGVDFHAKQNFLALAPTLQPATLIHGNSRISWIQNGPLRLLKPPPPPIHAAPPPAAPPA